MSDTRRQVVMEAVEAAIAHCEAGSFSEAEAMLHDANVSPDEAPGVVYFHASILMALNRWPQALVRLNALAAVAAEEASVHLRRATCLISMGHLADARAVLEGEHAVRGQSLRYVLLARIAARKGRLGESASLLREACRADRGAALLVLQRTRLAAIVQRRIQTDDVEDTTQDPPRVH